MLIPFLSFNWNTYTFIFLVLSIPPWVAAFIFSLQYIKRRKAYFYSFFALTFIANLLVFFSDNFLTLLVAFEWMSLLSFMLVIYDRTDASLKAGKLYLTFSLFSGFFILAGIILSIDQSLNVLAYTVMSIGFLIKCGAFPFQVWLPEAHPVAPAPASAILSACLVKVGFFGLIRLMVFFQPKNLNFGLFIIFTALITMILGAVQALLQSQAKRMLAFHSVSQMGYVLLGLGLWIITGSEVTLLGSILHAMNHAYFKSSLFLAVGSVGQEYKQSSVDMYQVKGFFQRNPWVSICFLVAVLGISGAPFFNGFVSKTLLHEELVHSHYHYPFFKHIETIFMITAIGTFVSNFKMFYLMNRNVKKIRVQWNKVNIFQFLPLVILSVFIILFGVMPVLYENLIPFDIREASFVFLEEITPFHPMFNHGIPGIILIEFIGIVLIYFGLKTGLFHMKIPYYTLYVWTFFYNNLEKFFRWPIKKMEIIIGGIYYRVQIFFNSLILNTCHTIDDKIICTYGNTSRIIDRIFTVSCQREDCEALRYNDFVEKYGKVLVVWLLALIILATVLFFWVYLGYFA